MNVLEIKAKFMHYMDKLVNVWFHECLRGGKGGGTGVGAEVKGSSSPASDAPEIP